MILEILDDLLTIIKTENDTKNAFLSVIKLGENKINSKIWKGFYLMDIENDINDAKDWLHNTIISYPKMNGIYLGLDTLNMDSGNGSNVEIGLTEKCNPAILNNDWIFECEFYGESHLIKGLSDVEKYFTNENKWTYKERSFAEFLIFIGYSGIVFKEALSSLNLKNDFLSVWGFHDGDVFYLMQKFKEEKSLIAATCN